MVSLDYIQSNKGYVEALFQRYLQNPGSVSVEWQMFFQGMELASATKTSHRTFNQKELAVFQLISDYREDGHLKAHLDPLKLQNPPKPQALNNSLGKHLQFKKSQNLSASLSPDDLNTHFQSSSIIGKAPGQKLKDIITFLENTYCKTLSLQVGACRPEVREWFFNEFEGRGTTFKLSLEQKKDFLHDLIQAEALERFLHSRFVGAKRFSIEGADVLIPMLSYLAQFQTPVPPVEELVIGMSHRGRLNVLCNFLNQAVDILFMEFDGGRFLKAFDFDGDVKYHAGYSAVKKFSNGKTCNVLLAYNPSHLEAVNSVVCGVTRARQRVYNDQQNRQKVMSVLIHGDGAFCGQGSVSETLQLSNLQGYTTGGTLHIILNNQVGFTTDPKDARSSIHASDLAKSIEAPIILVNADDVPACLHAVDMAIRFRGQFGQDVFIELVCYRRFGHNESDEPAFTQPLMYNTIKNHPRVKDIYLNSLVKENIVTTEYSNNFYNNYFQKLQTILDSTRVESEGQKGVQKSKTGGVKLFSKESLKGVLWSHSKKVKEEDFFTPVDTCPLDKDLQKVLDILVYKPQGFNVHPKIEKLIKNRQNMVKSDSLDWALCELLAYGTLCLENHPVRISGQDCIRGTFSHRHAMYFDTLSSKGYSPLAGLNPKKGEFCIYNSPLSEMAVLGFEYGNSCMDPSFFTLWEAQFGDFSNGAQIIIDQFISSGEEKWMQSCSLVLLLPHGYEGQGPEHSSARMERYLQLCAQGNMQVCYPTTPANFFHLLRRQVKRPFRKPLIVMTPKSLLRHPEVVSSKKELIRSYGFQEVLPDTQVKKPKDIEVLMLCSGKIYFDLNAERKKSLSDWKHVALVRVEQLYPFPAVPLTPWLNGYPRLKKVIWVQEEPVNMGAYSYIVPRVQNLMEALGRNTLPLVALSRPEKASPATGSLAIHKEEFDNLINSVHQHL